MVKAKSEYVLNFDAIKADVKRMGGLKRFATELDIKYRRMWAMIYQGTAITNEELQIISEFTSKTIDELRLDRMAVNRLKEDRMDAMSEFKLSEEILIGLKNNVSKKLEMHTLPFINDVQSIVNQIAIESAYLGIIAVKAGNTKFIEDAIIKRRSK